MFEWTDIGFVAAVADGATEGMLSEIWARILAAHAREMFLEGGGSSRLLSTATNIWQRFKRAKASAGKPLTRLPAWLEEPSVAQGAFSTIAAINLRLNRTWRAVMVGDSCIFQIRGDILQRHGPMGSSAEFAKRPYLLCSEQGPSQKLIDETQTLDGEWGDEDVFLLMSDALACWCLHQHEKGDNPWLPLLNLGIEEGGESFEAIVARWREEGMRNDDVTLVRLFTS